MSSSTSEEWFKRGWEVVKMIKANILSLSLSLLILCYKLRNREIVMCIHDLIFLFNAHDQSDNFSYPQQSTLFLRELFSKRKKGGKPQVED